MYRRAGYVFAGLFALTLLAFWRTYLSELPGAFDVYTHAHAVVMIVWFAIVIAQPFLIRREHRALHRALGKLSCVVVPAVVVSIVLLDHARIRALPDAAVAGEAFVHFLPFGMIVLLGTAYVLALVHRKTVALHARYMLCTALGVVDPIVARIVFFYGPELPRPEYTQLVSLAVSALALGLLIVRERDQRTGRTAFPTMLALTVAVYGGFFTFARTSTWEAIVHGFRALPLT